MKVHNLKVTGSLTSGGETLTNISASVATVVGTLTSNIGSIESKTGSYATTGSNLLKGDQTISGSVIPSVTNTYDLGDPTHNFRHLYLSSASLYIDGTKVLGSTSQELQITTDTGQSFKILEAGSDTITLQSADGNVTLATSGGGDVILDPTTGVIALKGTTTLYAGNKILSSDGNAVHFGNSVTMTGSLIVTGFIETQELRTTYISSSVLYRSGSTKFGDELTDTHSFTGSLSISGSISVPGSGLLSGSSQVDVMSTTNIARLATTGSNTFTSNQIVSGSITSVGSSPLLKFINTSEGAGAGSIQFYSGSSQIWNLGTHTNNDMYLYNNTTGTYNYWIQNSTGYVGINTNNPSRQLHVVDGTSATIAATKTGTDSAQIGVDSVSYFAAGGDLTFRVGGFLVGSEKIRLTTTGRLGIGTNNPGNTLHVYGGGILVENNQDYRTKNSSGTQRTLLYMNSSNKVSLVNDDGDICLSATGNIGAGTTTPLNMMNNNGMQISRGGHTTLLIGDGGTNGGVVQSSDSLRRVFIGANVYDDVTNSWQQFTDTYGFAAFDAISNNSDGGMARILVGSGNDSGYAGSNIFFEAYKSNSDSYLKLRTATADNSLYISNNGNISMNTTTNAGALNIGPSDARKISFESTTNFRSTTLFKSYSMNGTDTTWCRIRLENNYAQNFQGVWGTITVGYHPYHASMGRFYQYRFFQSPYGTNNSYMKIATVFEEVFGWDYYQFSSDVQFYNFENYLYIKVIGQYGSINYMRSVRADLTGANVAMDTVQLEVDVAAPARLGLITKNGAAAPSA